jgi:transcriptional regulator with XRE-family HTH domain
MEEPGQKLKKIRERLKLRFRDVEEASVRIAALHSNDEFVIALSRLADIENKGTMPSAYRLYSLCAIYRLDMAEVLKWYGVSLSTLPADAAVVQHTQTHVINFRAEDGEVQVPISLDPGIDLTKTVFLSRLIQRWGTLPLMLFNNIDVKSFRYGLIGSDDWSMFPIIPPGSLVVIDDTKRKITNNGWSSEFERPIYFLEHREGYVCGWCSLRDGNVTVQPHPASLCEPKTYRYPEEIEVIGQVTQVAMSLDPSLRRRVPGGA